ncbi:hypothetical protein M758_UG021200 [Ceratodon purpureus]|nr:hypothetical protein M758_UG021200 [Ceratodon purpureus]
MLLFVRSWFVIHLLLFPFYSPQNTVAEFRSRETYILCHKTVEPSLPSSGVMTGLHVANLNYMIRGKTKIN